MKYVSLKENKLKHLNIPVMKKGLDFRDKLDLDEKDYLSNCKNVYYSDGLLKTRKGFYANKSHIIKSSLVTDDSFQSCTLTGTEVVVDEKTYRIVIDYTQVASSDQYITIFFIGADREKRAAGSLSFKRISEEIFYIPSNITFFQAAAKNGGGIYAFVTCSNMYDYEDKTYSIYEIDSDYESWELSTDYYIPIAYVNGRGDSFEKAVETKQIYMGEPHLLEPLNLLNGTFLAYFSSDGYSSRFSLPFSKLTDETVSCRIYYTETKYMDWSVSAGSNSDTKKFFSADVTMNVDRNKGEIYFTVEDGDFSVPLMSKYKANNIKITATKRNDEDFGAVVSSSSCSVMNSCLVFSGGNESCMVFTSNYDNPLYFRFNGTTLIGEPNAPITAMSTQADSIIAFKKNSIYRLKVKKGELLDANAILADISRNYYDNNTVSITEISRKNGCLNFNSITFIDGKIVWLDTNKQVYEFSSSFNFQKITDKISTYLQNLDDVSFEESGIVAGDDGIYIYLGNKVVFGQYNFLENNISWFIWEMPENMHIMGGIENVSPVFLCSNNYTTYYLTILSGNTDSLMSRVSTDDYKISYKIPSFVETPHLMPDGINQNKKFSKVDILFSLLGESKLTINGKQIDFSGLTLSEEVKKITVLPEIKNFREVYIKLESDESMALGDIDIYYNRFT